MYDNVKYIIQANALSDKTYVEPFAGGFGVGICLLSEEIVSNAIINDVDFHIYAFWKAVFNAPDKLIQKIRETPITISEWKKQRIAYEKCDRRAYIQVAFSTLFLNRTNFSGVLKAGPIGGQDQSGNYKIDCRFPKERICTLIEDISEFKDKVEIYNLDAQEFILKILKPRQKNLFINFDPPYVQKGKALYTNFYEHKDHTSLRDCIVNNLSCDWIMTYDNDSLIAEEYKELNIREFNLGYSAREHKIGTELFISKEEYKTNIPALV